MKQVYTFRWDKKQLAYTIALPILVVLPYIVLWDFLSLNDSSSKMAIFLGIPLCIFLVSAFLYIKLSHCIRHIEVDRGKIFIERYVGGVLVLSDIQDIKPVMKEEFDEHTTYQAKRNEKYGLDSTQYGLSLKVYTFNSSVYGDFTRISNSLDDLALVILCDGKKYLINYPSELLDEKEIARICRKA